MAIFFSPVEQPDQWSFSVETVIVPQGLRYQGYSLKVARLTRTTLGDIIIPAHAILKKVKNDAGNVFVEIQVNPIKLLSISSHFKAGAPTFYIIFNNESGLIFNDFDNGQESTLLKADVSFAIGFIQQDRLPRDPILWSEMILNALQAGGITSNWNAFNMALSTGLNTNTAPVILLNSGGHLLSNVTLDIVRNESSVEMVYTAIMTPEDNGDLQRTVSRMNAANPTTMSIPSLWDGGITTFLLRRSTALGGDFQFARLEDGMHQENEIEVNRNHRHIQLTNITDWIAEQFAVPLGALESPLDSYSRGNELKTFINGIEFFDHLFDQLNVANGSDHGFHHVGYLVMAKDELTKRGKDNLESYAITLEQAANVIGGKMCVLPARFYQFDVPLDTAVSLAAIANVLVVGGVLILDAFEVDWAATDPIGATIAMTTILVAPLVITLLLNNLDALIEPNNGVVDLLNSLANTTAILSAYPATVADNPRASLVGQFPFDDIFSIGDKFGIHHQKFSVLKNENGFMGFCGGIDLNPNRLDDEFHLIRKPYHDIHAKVIGPAVRDMAITFEQRWTHDGGASTDLSFVVPAKTDLETPDGDIIVQVARTYFQTSDTTRRFPFSPAGDRTILNTTLKAIASAKEFIYIEDQYFTPSGEYRLALIQKVVNREIKKLIIIVPDSTDQPFGDFERSEFVEELKTADTEGDIVIAGFPKRHYTTEDNNRKASSGRLLLMQDMEDTDSTASTPEVVFLGPPSRLPSPPFYVAIDGEIMYVTNVNVLLPNPDEDNLKIFEVLRGDKLPIIKGGTSPKGPKRSKHKKGAAATVINLAGIYVHSKFMIIDDVFMGVGSANVNKRGFYHDSETHLYTIPQGLGTHEDNPILELRLQLWADMMNLPREMAAPLLRDVVEAAELFGRSPLAGNRFTPLDARPTKLMAGISPDGGLTGKLLGALIPITASFDHDKLFDSVIDPTTELEDVSP